MFPENDDLPHLLFQTLAGLLMIAGITADLCIAALVQTRRLILTLRGAAVLTQRPFTFFHASLALSVTLLFTVPSLFDSSGAVPQESALILGPLFYALTGLLVITLCLTYSQAPFRQAFFSPRCSTRQALITGLLFGLASLPPIVLLSLTVSTVSETLGYEPQFQPVFDWLNDRSLALGTRVFLLFSAIFVAPVLEELLFRGILFPSLLKTRPFFFAALLSGFYFALIHFHATSFLPLLALSIAFSAGYAATGSILTPITMHMLFNSASILFFYAG